MVGVLMQQVDAEALPGVAPTVFGAKPSRRLRESFGKGCDLVGDPARIALFRRNRAQITHILLEAVCGRHGIVLRGKGAGAILRRSPRVKRPLGLTNRAIAYDKRPANPGREVHRGREACSGGVLNPPSPPTHPTAKLTPPPPHPQST